MYTFTQSIVSVASAVNPQLALPSQVGRVAIVILNATNGQLDFEPIEILSIGGKLVSLAFGVHQILKWRDWHNLLEREWWIGSSGVGIINIAEIVVS